MNSLLWKYRLLFVHFRTNPKCVIINIFNTTHIDSGHFHFKNRTPRLVYKISDCFWQEVFKSEIHHLPSTHGCTQNMYSYFCQLTKCLSVINKTLLNCLWYNYCILWSYGCLVRLMHGIVSFIFYWRFWWKANYMEKVNMSS